MSDNDQWSLGNVIKSTDEYQFKLQQKRQEIAIQHSDRHEQSRITTQSNTYFTASSLLSQQFQEKDREIQRLRLQIETFKSELQDTKQQHNDETSALQEVLQTKGRQLQQLLCELQEKQQTVATLKSENENKEKLLEQLLQEQERR